MYLHVLGSCQDIGHRVCHVICLQTWQGVADGSCSSRVIRVHGGLELSLHQAGGDCCHPDVGPAISYFLSPAFQQTSHRKLCSSVEPGMQQVEKAARRRIEITW